MYLIGTTLFPRRVNGSASVLAIIRTRRTSKRPPHSALLVALYDILDTCIRATDQHANTNTKHQSVRNGEDDVLPVGVPFALLDDGEPEEGREVKGEAADEQTRDNAKKGVEERNSLGNHPGDDRESRYKHQPDGPTLSRVDETKLRFGESAAHDVFADNGGVDGPRDEDYGKRDTESDA